MKKMTPMMEAVNNPEYIVGDVVLFKMPRGRQNMKYGQGKILSAGYYPHLACGGRPQNGWTYDIEDPNNYKRHLYHYEIIKKII